jgi:hypothetical protein
MPSMSALGAILLPGTQILDGERRWGDAANRVGLDKVCTSGDAALEGRKHGRRPREQKALPGRQEAKIGRILGFM